MGVLSYTFTAVVQPLKQKLQEVKNSMSSTDKSMKDMSKGIQDESKKVSGDAGAEIGGFTDGISAINPAAGQAVGGMKKMSVAAKALQAAMGPIGLALMALSAAVAALTAYFKGSVDGQQQWAKIMGYLGGVVTVFKNILIELGRWLVKAFKDPQGAIKELWEIIKQNLINRFKGMVGMVQAGWKVLSSGAKAVGLAVKGIFSKEAREESKKYFREAGEAALEFGEMYLQAVTGVEDVVGKIAGGAKKINEIAKESSSLKEREIQLQLDEIDNKTKIAKLDADIATQRRIANDDQQDLNEQIAAQERAMGLVEEKFAIQEKMAQEALAIQQEQMALGENSIEDLEKEADLQAALIGLQQSRDNEMRNLLRRHGTLMNQQDSESKAVQKAIQAERKARQDAIDKKKKAEAEAAKEEKERRAEIIRGIVDAQRTEAQVVHDANQEKLQAHEWTEAQKAIITENYQGQLKDLASDHLDDIMEMGITETDMIAEELEKRLELHRLTDQQRLAVTQYYQGLIDDLMAEREDKERDEQDAILDNIRKSKMSEAEIIEGQMKRVLEAHEWTESERAEITEHYNDRIKESTEETTSFMASAFQNMTQMAGGAMAGMLNEIGQGFTGAETDFRSYVGSMMNGLQQIINGLLAQAIAAMIAGEASKGLIGLATAAVGVGALKAMFESNVPKMKYGGVVPPGYPNDSYPAMLTSGETVTPPKALPQQQSGPVTARIENAGPDLLIYLEQQGQRMKGAY